MTSERVYVEVSGLTGTGKSAVMGEIEIALRALGLTIEHDAGFQSEKNMTHADWQTALDLYSPVVVLRERNIPRSTARATPPAQGEAVACQACGGRIEGWTCQVCARVFLENDAGALVMDTAPPPVTPDREAVARIVDPETFDHIEYYTGIDRRDGLSAAEREPSVFKAYPQLKDARDAAFAKADAILALRAGEVVEISAAHPAGGEG